MAVTFNASASGGGGGGGGGMDYMSGIANIGNALNNTWQQYHDLFKTFGWLPKDEQDKLMAAQRKLIEAQANNIGKASDSEMYAKQSQNRQLGMGGIGMLADTRMNAQKRARDVSFQNDLLGILR